MNLTWVIVGYGLAAIFTLVGTLGLHWDKWHKKADDVPKKMEQSINNSPNATAYQAGRDLKTK